MKEYLKMADVFVGHVIHDHDRNFITMGYNNVADFGFSSNLATYTAHAINSHDELVTMNKELLEALEAVIEWYDMEADHSIEPDFYKRMASCQVSEDMAREAIAKAKGV